MLCVEVAPSCVLLSRCVYQLSHCLWQVHIQGGMSYSSGSQDTPWLDCCLQHSSEITKVSAKGFLNIRFVYVCVYVKKKWM